MLVRIATERYGAGRMLSPPIGPLSQRARSHKAEGTVREIRTHRPKIGRTLVRPGFWRRGLTSLPCRIHDAFLWVERFRDRPTCNYAAGAVRAGAERVKNRRPQLPLEDWVHVSFRRMGRKSASVDQLTKDAVAHYWLTLAAADKKSKKKGTKDTGKRSAVTSGKQMSGFCTLVNALLIEWGLPEANIYITKRLEIPGFFRANKNWDMLVVDEHQGKKRLVASMEFKSQAGSFGNNFNNRSEEAIGTAVDIATAIRDGAFGQTAVPPWLGWVMLVEDCKESTRPVGVKEPHFKVFDEFRNASYAKRYELLLRRMVMERLYDKAALLMSSRDEGPNGVYREPASDLSMKVFLAALEGHVKAYLASIEG